MAGGRAITSDIEQLDLRSPLQQTFLAALARFLTPVVKLLLKCGIGCSEFTAVAKAVFVQVASEEYGIRGRQTNLSRVAAMTGMSRKEVRRIRSSNMHSRWTPGMASSPANSIIHFWHYDPDFSDPPGTPRRLPIDGEPSFTSLVRRYAGDIPPGALRKELRRAGTIVEDDSGLLMVRQRYFCPSYFDDDFVRNVAFSLANLANTIVYNAKLISAVDSAERRDPVLRRVERSAWTERMSPERIPEFKKWVHQEGARFIENADNWIGENELPKSEWPQIAARAVGVGIYYFEED